jgi:tetratricopeptide (TPR) repeat protein
VSGGNPLALELLTREWAAHGPASLLRDVEALDTQPVPALGIPRAIGAVFDRQSRRLDAATRAALDLAAVLGRRLLDLALYAAVELAPGQAAEALSRLKDEGLLREVRGDLEFRNELIRAQAYYAVAGPARQHLHRRVGELLAARPPQEDKSVSLEIAWHYLRGGEAARAVPYAHEGAERFLAVGAPHEAEELIGALIAAMGVSGVPRKMVVLLIRALLDQSKADVALPLIEKVEGSPDLTLKHRAEIVRLRAMAEFALNREGERYYDAVKSALAIARETGDPVLIADALFESARAGSESGLKDLLTTARDESRRLRELTGPSCSPMVLLTQAFCKLNLQDPSGALDDLQTILDGAERHPALLSMTYSGVGMAQTFLCNLEKAHDAFARGIEVTRRLGDDARASTLAANLCAVEVSRGRFEEAVRFGQMSIQLGQASRNNNPVLLTTYTNLLDAYVLSGRRAEALDCADKARTWIASERRWKVRCAFQTEMAAFALVQGNVHLALDLIARLEDIARDREESVPMPGAYWKLKVFRAAHLGRTDEAFHMVRIIGAQFEHNCPFFYLDVLAARAWLERRVLGREKTETEEEIQMFERMGATGRKALLIAQGFLTTN